MESRMIDLHAHLIPDFYVKKMREKGVDGAVFTPFPRWSPEKDLKVMQANGIDKRVLSLSTPGVYLEKGSFHRDMAHACNEYAAELIKTYPQHYGAFATLPFPDIEASLREIEYALDTLKLDGVTFFSNVNGRYYGEPEFEVLFQELNKRRAVVFVHPEDLPVQKEEQQILAPIIDRCMDTGRSVFYLHKRGLIRKYQELRFVVAHGGGSFPLMIRNRGRGRTLDDDFSLYKERIFFDTAQQGDVLFRYLQGFAGVQQMVIGTDGGWQSPIQVSLTLKAFRKYGGFDDSQRKIIERDNALRLFPRLKNPKEKRISEGEAS